VIPAANASRPVGPDARPVAVIVQQGKILDFIDGVTQRNETPEEYVRQEIAKSLVREYGYAKKAIAVEFLLRLGTRRPRADLVVFAEDASHTQENAMMIVECKAQSVKATDRKEGVGQLHSYMAACPNVIYGMWTNGLDRLCYRHIVKDGHVLFDEVPRYSSEGPQ
jgi:type I restriction enzyme M protein